MEVADVNQLSFRRKRDAPNRARSSQRKKLLSYFSKTNRFLTTQIENLTVACFVCTGKQERFNNIINVIQITALFASTKKVNRSAVDCLANKPGHETLAIVMHQLSWAISISQPKTNSPHTIELMVKQMVIFRRELVNSIYVGWSDAVQLVYRKIKWFAVDLPSAAKDYLHMGIKLATRLQELKLGSTVQGEIRLWFQHRADMADTSR